MKKCNLNTMGIIFVAIVMVISLFSANALDVQAAESKSAYYEAYLIGMGVSGDGDGWVSAAIKDGNLVVKGSLYKAKSIEKYYDGDRKLLKSKTRKFKLAKNCKYLGSGGDVTLKYTKKEMEELLVNGGGLILCIYINSKGYVKQIYIGS